MNWNRHIQGLIWLWFFGGIIFFPPMDQAGEVPGREPIGNTASEAFFDWP